MGDALQTPYCPSVTFSPNGSLLIVCGKDGNGVGFAKKFSVSQGVTFVGDICENEETGFISDVDNATFSPDGGALIFTGRIGAKVFEVSGTTESYIRNLVATTTALSSTVNTAAFSPDRRMLVLGGSFTKRAKVYSVSGTTIMDIGDIMADAGSTMLSSTVNTAAFSPDGNALVLGGSFTGRAKVYAVSGTTVTYVSDIYADAGTNALDGLVDTAAFSPDGRTLVLGGNFTRRAKVYSVSGTTVTYARDIYADAGTTTLSSTVDTAAFSPDGNALVLGGSFTGRAKIYAVTNTTVTYVSDIYADAGTTTLSSEVNTAAFSPDGNALVLGGSFTGRAKIYAVSDTTVTYVSDIYADAGTTALSNYVDSAVFSPDSRTLVLGGNFTGHAKIYAVSSTTVTYVSDIKADAGSAMLSNKVNTTALSPDGSMLVLGGEFTGRAKAYGFDLQAQQILYEKRIYLAENGIVKKNYADVGFSKSNIEIGDTGKAKMIGYLSVDFKLPPIPNFAGALTLTGSYAHDKYFTQSGCSLGVDTILKQAYVTIQSGSTTSYENIVFTLASAPAGIAMLDYPINQHASNKTKCFYTCVLTGVSKKINVSVDLNALNATYDTVTAALTVSWA